MKESKVFSVGDKIEILPWEDIIRDSSAHVVKDNVYFDGHDFCFNEQMKIYCGKKATIEKVMVEYDRGYRGYMSIYNINIDDGEWSWLGEWLKKI